MERGVDPIRRLHPALVLGHVDRRPIREIKHRLAEDGPGRETGGCIEGILALQQDRKRAFGRGDRRVPPALSVGEHDEGEVAMQQPRGGAHDALEHRPRVGRRLADDPQDLRGRGLPLQRDADVARARLHLVEQPHVLDRDHRLVGEGRDEFDLALRERNRRAARQRKGADRFAVAHQRHAEHGAHVAQASLFLLLIFRVVPGVGDLDRPVLQGDASDQASPAGPDLGRLFMLEVGGIDDHLTCRIAVDVAMTAEDLPVLGVAQTHRSRDQRFENRIEVEGRSADRLEHVGRRGLLREGLFEIAGLGLRFLKHSRVLDRDCRLIGEGLKQRHLLFGKRAARAGDADGADALVLPDHRREGDGVVADDFADPAQHRRRVRIVENIRIVRDAALAYGAACRRRLPWLGERGQDRFARLAQIGGHLQQALVVDQQHVELVAVEQLLAALEDLVEDGLRVGDGPADDAENIGARPLLLQRLLRLVEQARVLDRDRRLIGKALQKRGFPLREGFGRRADHQDRAEAAVLRQHRRIEERRASQALGAFANGRRDTRLGREIGNVVGAALANDPAGHAFADGRHVMADFLGPRAAPSRNAHHIVVADRVDADLLAAEQPLAGVDNGLEHRRRVGDRFADRAQYVGGGLLLLQRLLRLVEEPRVLDRDDRLVGEGLQQIHVVADRKRRAPCV